MGAASFCHLQMVYVRFGHLYQKNTSMEDACGGIAGFSIAWSEAEKSKFVCICRMVYCQ
jgi:hypothetical protein